MTTQASTTKQSALMAFLTSTLGQKYLTALTGFFLVLFSITHVSANLTLLSPDSETFNRYTAKLASFGGLLYVAEAGLLITALVHIFVAVTLRRRAATARPTGYSMTRTKGGPSKANASSKYMIVSGIILTIFLVLHVRLFKFGPNIEQGYAVDLDGRTERDLYRWVIECFQNPALVGWYVVAMIFLGLHLRHGIWSVFQSLGANGPQVSKPLYRFGTAAAILIAGAFAIIPIYVYIRGLS
jgi:succinate dehydrogenase / fumarate reductase cytochrome b subunit